MELILTPLPNKIINIKITFFYKELAVFQEARLFFWGETFSLLIEMKESLHLKQAYDNISMVLVRAKI